MFTDDNVCSLPKARTYKPKLALLRKFWN